MSGDKEIGYMILNLQEGEDCFIPGSVIVSEERKPIVAREISLELKRMLAAGLICLLLHCGNAFASIDAELPALAQKIILAESSGNPRAIGDNGKSRGLMQIQEDTWRRHTTTSWSRAFEPALNYKVGMAELERIVKVYRARGIEPSAAYVVWAYNTGSFIKRSLPKTLKGELHPWTWNHPNLTYRAIYREALS